MDTPHGKDLRHLLITAIASGLIGALILAYACFNPSSLAGGLDFVATVAAGSILVLVSIGGYLYLSRRERPSAHKGQTSDASPVTRSEMPAPQTVALPPAPKQTQSPFMVLAPVTKMNEQDKAILATATSTVANSNPSLVLCVMVQPEFLERNSHDWAKAVLTEVAKEWFYGSAEFPLSCRIPDPERLSGSLDPSVFTFFDISAIEEEISKSGRNVHLFQVESRYDGAPVTKEQIPKPGYAMTFTEKERAQQSVRALRVHPNSLECLSAFLSTPGFNMLNQVLRDEKSVSGGYFIPKELTTLTQKFKENYDKTEYVCYSFRFKRLDHPHHIFLQGAPKIEKDQQETDELQRYAALSNFAALFQYGIALADEFKYNPRLSNENADKKVILHTSAVGCSDILNNTVDNVQWGFEKAALFFQEDLKRYGVSVHLDAEKGKGPMGQIAKNLLK